MRYSCLHYLLILLIAGQSVLVMADLHPIDQAGTTTSEFAFFNDTDISPAHAAASQHADASEDGCIDCHYCYCCIFLAISVDVYKPFDGAGQLNSDYTLSVIEPPRTPFLRPTKT